MHRPPHERPRVGISRCLLGDEVRYDGGHKRDAALLATLGRLFEWVPVCPEIEVGMGVPREPIELVAGAAGVAPGGVPVRLLGVTSRTDWTTPMATYAARRADALASMPLSGYVLKRGSPSCGLRVPVRSPRGHAGRTGRGLFAEALVARLPQLPVEEEDRLHDPDVQDGFVERVFACARLQRLFASPWTAASLAAFQRDHALQLMAHSRRGYAALERLVATAGDAPTTARLARAYESLFMATLARPATPAGHAAALAHAVRLLQPVARPRHREELQARLEAYRMGRVPRSVPLGLVRRLARRCGVDLVNRQTYLDVRRTRLPAARQSTRVSSRSTPESALSGSTGSFRPSRTASS